MTVDFDQKIDRSFSHSLKFDARTAYFGRSDVIPMWVADMDFAAPEAVTKALVERAKHPVYGYTLHPDSMYEALIEWSAKRYHWQIKQSDIIMCPGVVPSINATIEAITEPGDKVIVQSPVYFPFFSSVEKTGRELVLNPLYLDNNRYYIDFEHLEKCAQQGAKTLLFCSPHNPVGRVWTRAELQQLLELSERYQLTIISDEIHADLIFPEHQHISLATLSHTNNVITTLAPSKTFNIAGMGLSTLIVSDAQQRKAIKAVFEQWHISPANPFSITAFEAAYSYGEDWLEQLNVYIYKNKKWVEDFLQKRCPQIKLIESEGTYLLWLDCRALGMDNETLKCFFIEKAGVGMNPGYVFGDNGSGFMRLNIGTRIEIVQQAMERIADAIDGLRTD
ncbi:pyridoxal phosphate-dependent aminotransferase [Methylophaga sulfidovorans]|uniref:cysteine-S-conjugate beta-lyase n=1 Tax=Methylophaga sulfidovorans TaxID=45496 RepID=A0A1I3TZ03_9GAMM|nr:pyridoxal phosphate-dependent aminotransferase [Methylophaga sulfidovorans]SFJ75965.1 cystathione beta-lyase [Methylophaga sulfidovorans]